MDKNVIGQNAGIVWNLLSDGKQWTYSELLRASALDAHDLDAAIGWLAREDKIEFGRDERSGEETFYLVLNVYF